MNARRREPGPDVADRLRVGVSRNGTWLRASRDVADQVMRVAVSVGLAGSECAAPQPAKP